MPTLQPWQHRLNVLLGRDAARAIGSDSVIAGITAFLGTRHGGVLNGARRTIEYRRRPGETHIYAVVADGEIVSTAVGYSLRFLAGAAERQPHLIAGYLPLIDELAGLALSLQHQTEGTARFGGFKLSPSIGSASAYGAAMVGLGLLAAWRVTLNPLYLDACRKAAQFLALLNDPNPFYQATYGTTPIPAHALNAGFCGFLDQVSADDTILTTHTTWNVLGCKFLRELHDVTGVAAYRTLCNAVRDWGAPGFTGFHDFWSVYYAQAPAKTSNNWFASGMAVNAGRWHRRGEVVTSGGLVVNSIGTDQMEYALEALYDTGYPVTPLRMAYEHLRSLPNADSTFGAHYDSRICWPGFFRINAPVYGGASKAYGSHYDIQGIGPLLKFKREQYPDDYAASIEQAVKVPRLGTLADKDFETIWSAGDGYEFATIGTGTVKGCLGVGILESS